MEIIYNLLKRTLDIIVSFLGLTLLSPVFLIISIIIILESKGGVFFLQHRVGKDYRDFILIKFRTMRTENKSDNLITIGAKDPRLTRVGYYLRKYKLDELPQFINVLKGEMSLVGPRPEVPKYVQLYDDNQKKILLIKPGLTCYASVLYRNESVLLAHQEDPERYYIEKILPDKINIDMKYVEHHNLFIDLKIILQTIKEVILN